MPSCQRLRQSGTAIVRAAPRSSQTSSRHLAPVLSTNPAFVSRRTRGLPDGLGRVARPHAPTRVPLPVLSELWCSQPTCRRCYLDMRLRTSALARSYNCGLELAKGGNGQRLKRCPGLGAGLQALARADFRCTQPLPFRDMRHTKMGSALDRRSSILERRPKKRGDPLRDRLRLSPVFRFCA